MRLEAHPQNDRLQRWRILDADTSGRGKEIIAENIRFEDVAKFIVDQMNSFPGTFAELKIRATRCLK